VTDLHAPSAVLDVELSSAVVPTTPGPALVLVRLHGVPVGTLRAAEGQVASVAALAATARAQLGRELSGALTEAGLPPTLADQAPLVPPTPPAALPADLPSVAVVVCTLRRPQALRRALQSLAAVPAPDFEVVVVDNAGGDPATRDVVEAAGFGAGRIRLVQEPRRGLSRARNAGLAAVTADVVAFTDDDVVVDPGWVGALAVHFRDAPVHGVTGLTLPVELETPAQVWFEEFGGFSRGFKRQRYDPPALRTSTLYPYTPGRFGSGANMAFRRTALLAAGGFDVALGAGTPARGGEDLDMFLTVLLAGGTLVYEPAALAWHQHRREHDELVRQVRDYGTGLTAMLTKRMLNGPAERRALARRVRGGLRHLLSSSSEKNMYKGPGFPSALTRWERAGMVVGPVAYARSRRAGRTT